MARSRRCGESRVSALLLLGNFIGISGDENAVSGDLPRGFDGITIVDVARLFGVQMHRLSVVQSHSDGIVFADLLHSSETARTDTQLSVRGGELNTLSLRQFARLFTVDGAFRAVCCLSSAGL